MKRSVPDLELPGRFPLKRANKNYYPSRSKNRILDLGFLRFVSNFFSENNIFFNFVKARLTGLASRKFLFLPKSKILNSQEKILMKTGQDQVIKCIHLIT